MCIEAEPVVCLFMVLQYLRTIFSTFLHSAIVVQCLIFHFFNMEYLFIPLRHFSLEAFGVLHSRLVEASELPVVSIYSGLFIHISLRSELGVVEGCFLFLNMNLICKCSGIS